MESARGGAQAIGSATAPRSSVSDDDGDAIEEKRMQKSGGAQAVARPLPPIKEKRRTTSATAHGAASSPAPPLRQSRVASRADGASKGDNGRTKSGSAQAVASSPAQAPPRRQNRVSGYWALIREKRRSTRQPAMPRPPRRATVALLPNGLPADGIYRADVIEYYTHRDGAIYRSTDGLAKLYRLHDTSETGLEAMMRSEPTENCDPNWMSCGRHVPHTMMQIFSLKLAYPQAGDQLEVYGFMAVRDSLDPLRNYVFKRSRDNPLIVDREDGLIQMCGPKRGIWWHDMALVEFDMRIKRGKKEADDLQLIDGAVWFNDRASIHARVVTMRIDGDYGSVDICYALLHSAMEATVQIAVVGELLSGFSLVATAFYISDLLHQEMQLFDGVIPGPPDGCHQIYKPDKWVLGTGGQRGYDRFKYVVFYGGRQRYEPEKCDGGSSTERYEVGKYVLAFPWATKLGLKLKICQSGGDTVLRFCMSPASTHGSDTFAFDLGFATIHVKISWSTLQLIRSPISGRLYT